MKNLKLIGGIAVTAISIAFSSLATADDAKNGPFFGNEAPGKWMVGVKLANIDPNVPDIKDTDAVGIVLGYEFATSVGSGKSSFEIEYISSDEGQVSVVNQLATIPGSSGAFGTYEADIFNAYFAYRSAGDLYYKLKAGLSYVDLNVAPVSLLDRDFEDVSFALGIGLGYRIKDMGAVEVEYTQDSGDSDLGTLGLNALLKF